MTPNATIGNRTTVHRVTAGSSVACGATGRQYARTAALRPTDAPVTCRSCNPDAVKAASSPKPVVDAEARRLGDLKAATDRLEMRRDLLRRNPGVTELAKVVADCEAKVIALGGEL